jgi:hypothetical protein
MAIGAQGRIGWSGTNSSPGSGKDVGLSRAAAGVLQADDGASSGNFIYYFQTI